MRVLLVRHAESEANVARRFHNRPPGPGLTSRGRDQARHLAWMLRHHDVRAIVSSPLARARQTAAVVGATRGLVVDVDDGWREFDVGSFEGTTDPRGWEEYDDVVRAWSQGDAAARVGGGECLTDLTDRLGRALRAALAGVTGDAAAIRGVGRGGSVGDVVAVTHGGLLRVVLPHLVTGIPTAWRHGWPHCGVGAVAVVHGIGAAPTWVGPAATDGPPPV